MGLIVGGNYVRCLAVVVTSMGLGGAKKLSRVFETIWRASQKGEISFY